MRLHTVAVLGFLSQATLAQSALAGPAVLPPLPASSTYVIYTRSGATYVGSWQPTDDQTGVLVTLGNGEVVRLERNDVAQIVPESQADPAASVFSAEAIATLQTPVELHVAPNPAQPNFRTEIRLERQDPRLKENDGWTTACTAPCLSPLDNRYNYRVTGTGITQSRTFQIGGPLTRLYISPADKGRYGVWLGLLITGAVLSGGAIYGASLGIPTTAAEWRPAAITAAAGAGAIGLGLLIAGCVKVRAYRTTVRVEAGALPAN